MLAGWLVWQGVQATARVSTTQRLLTQPLCSVATVPLESRVPRKDRHVTLQFTVKDSIERLGAALGTSSDAPPEVWVPPVHECSASVDTAASLLFGRGAALTRAGLSRSRSQPSVSSAS